MNFAIEHPFIFLAVCGVLIANAYRIVRTQRYLAAQPDATVLAFPR